MIFLNAVLTIMIFQVNLVNNQRLTSEAINSFISDSITFWNITTPIVFLNNEVSAYKLWQKLSDLCVSLLIFNTLTTERIEYVRKTYHQPMKLIVIGTSNSLRDAFTKILDSKILKFKIIVIFLCLDCNDVLFTYYNTFDIIGLIVLAHPLNESSVILHNSHYSYNFRGLTSVYIGQWNKDQKFLQNNSISSSNTVCFKDAILTALTSKNLPWSPKYANQTAFSAPVGFCGEILFLLSKMLNFRFRVVQSELGYNYGEMTENGKFNGVIGEFVEKNYDIGVGVYSRTISRETVIDFTTPISYSEMVFAAHVSTKLGSKYWSSTPSSVWLALVSIILLTTIAIKFSFKNEWKEDFPMDWFPITLATWFQQGGVGSPNHFSSRIIYLTMCAIFWLLVCLFSGLLVSLLSMDSSLTMMTTLSDLAKSDYTIGLTEGASSQEMILSTNDLKMKSLTNRFVTKATIDDALEAVCNQRRYAHLGGLTSFYHRLKQENVTCQYYFIKEPLGKDLYHFVTQNDNVLNRRLSLGISRLRSSGILSRLEKVYNVERLSIVKRAYSITNNNDQVRIDQLLIPFGLLIGGSCFALIALVCEIIIFKHQNRMKMKYGINDDSNN